MSDEKHCPTCICGRRAPVRADAGSHLRIDDPRRGNARGAGSITWAEHLEIYATYSARFGHEQPAERLAERGGFGFAEIVLLTGHEPKTWEPRR